MRVIKLEQITLNIPDLLYLAGKFIKRHLWHLKAYKKCNALVSLHSLFLAVKRHKIILVTAETQITCNSSSPSGNSWTCAFAPLFADWLELLVFRTARKQNKSDKMSASVSKIMRKYIMKFVKDINAENVLYSIYHLKHWTMYSVFKWDTDFYTMMSVNHYCNELWTTMSVLPEGMVQDPCTTVLRHYRMKLLSIINCALSNSKCSVLKWLSSKHYSTAGSSHVKY